MGVLNSCRPLRIKTVWMQNAKMPPALRTRDTMSPINDCSETKTKPYKIKKRSGKCMIKKPPMPPGNLKSSHSFQKAESISWIISSIAFIKYSQNKTVEAINANAPFLKAYFKENNSARVHVPSSWANWIQIGYPSSWFDAINFAEMSWRAIRLIKQSGYSKMEPTDWNSVRYRWVLVSQCFFIRRYWVTLNPVAINHDKGYCPAVC